MRPALLSVSGIKLEYSWYGPGAEDAPTLVFLHEGLGCAGMWRDFPPRLAAQTGCGARVDVHMLENCGHSPHREHEAETLEAMRKFVSKRPPSLF